MGELEADVGRTEALYLAVTEEGRAEGEEAASLTSLRTKLEREMVQIGAESLIADSMARMIATESRRRRSIWLKTVYAR